MVAAKASGVHTYDDVQLRLLSRLSEIAYGELSRAVHDANQQFEASVRQRLSEGPGTAPSSKGVFRCDA